MTDIQPAKQESNRGEDGKFKPGVSGNPNGRPKGKTIAGIIREKIEQADENGKTKIDKLADILINKAMDGDFKALELIWNYMDGKPDQKIDLGDSDKIDALRNDINKLIGDAKAGTTTINFPPTDSMPVSA